MTLSDLNKMGKDEAVKLFASCCGSAKWSTSLMKKFPFNNEKALIAAAGDMWYSECAEKDWLEAFTHHPKIGDVKSLSEKFAGKEQAAVGTASKDTIAQLAKANADYEIKFGFTFIVCATGKSADEMLRLLQERMKNTYEEELMIAMGEQQKITALRLQKLLPEADWSKLRMSQLTTHILDTAIGKPANNIVIRLQKQNEDKWQTIAQGETNADGRIANLLPPERILSPGGYKMVFETAAYFSRQSVQGFYPKVEIQFGIYDDAHYHVPLLISPYGYSTYRGS